jgi:lipopolysaccharide transport LptD-like protein
MRQMLRGVSHSGTPLFLSMLLALLLLVPAVVRAEAEVALEAQANTTAASEQPQDKISLFADHFHYEQENGILTAVGNVRVWYANVTLNADQAQANTDTNWVHASGNVVLIEQEREIKCAKLDYDLQTRSAKMYGILFATHPWYYQGASVEKVGEENVTILTARFTTCNSRHPHYHLKASQIDIILNDSLTAHHAVVYVGTTPLFYLPWIRRSLKDSRPPFSIRVGYNDFEGFFTKLKFNYYLWKDSYGGILLDFMEKKGVGVGLDHHMKYELCGKGEGNLSVLYVKDNEQDAERWTANMASRHEFTERDLLQINVDYLTDRSFNREFSYDLVDTFQQKSYLSYSHRGDSYYFSVGASDVESLDSEREVYYPSSRELPTLNFSLSSRKIVDMIYPIYFNLSSNVNRTYDRIVLSDIRYRYRDNFTVTPGFTQTLTLPVQVVTQPSLSGSISFPISGVYRETFYDDYDTWESELDTAYNTRVTLTNKWVNYRYTKITHLMQTRTSHEFTRKFPLLEEVSLSRSGITSHRLGLAADYFMGNFLTLQTSTAYDLLEHDQERDWRERMDALTLNGRATISPQVSLNAQGQHSWQKERITSGYLSSSIYSKQWNMTLSSSYAYLGTLAQDYSLFASLSAGYRPETGVSFTSVLQYDVVKKEFTNFSLSLSRDLHCWAMNAGFKVYSDGNLSVGLGINLKAFPEFKLGMGGAEGVSIGE